MVLSLGRTIAIVSILKSLLSLVTYASFIWNDDFFSWLTSNFFPKIISELKHEGVETSILARYYITILRERKYITKDSFLFGSSPSQS